MKVQFSRNVPFPHSWLTSQLYLGRWEKTEVLDGTWEPHPKSTSWERRFGWVVSLLWVIKAGDHISHMYQDSLWKLHYCLWSGLGLDFSAVLECTKGFSSCCKKSHSLQAILVYYRSVKTSEKKSCSLYLETRQYKTMHQRILQASLSITEP